MVASFRIGPQHRQSESRNWKVDGQLGERTRLACRFRRLAESLRKTEHQAAYQLGDGDGLELSERSAFSVRSR
jgi:hypothetical protein